MGTRQTETPKSAPRLEPRLPYETVALVLQGGGALGAYQAGVFEGLAEAAIALNWVAGISIGALNAALIAGNAPRHRVERLREFWDTICRPAAAPLLAPFVEQAIFDGGGAARNLLTAFQAGSSVLQGQNGFFQPRVPTPLPWVVSGPAKASWYDTAPLKTTLERLCDFDRINARDGMRVSVGAVNVASGNFVYFDNRRQTLRAEHFMASGALPPAFAPVEIDGQYFWDGGVVSNTPLAEVLSATPRRDTLAFQVDLWSARGAVPDSLDAVTERVKEIQYSSRTRMVTDTLQREQRYRRLLRELLEALPMAQREDLPASRAARELACGKQYNVVHLIYQKQDFDHDGKDFQFGATTMQSHWSAGLSDIRKTLANGAWLELPDNDAGFVTHDVHRAGRGAS
ncbi:MAG: patatin-like phospholipase family protein [Burkholderiaceae bacterium]|nr:patatin-like phospholipase family protein [Roseateles sp.]MBV8471695.1 patatin-like phospholipase family protein [Burkholderiaceae bacterium]